MRLVHLVHLVHLHTCKSNNRGEPHLLLLAALYVFPVQAVHMSLPDSPASLLLGRVPALHTLQLVKPAQQQGQRPLRVGFSAPRVCPEVGAQRQGVKTDAAQPSRSRCAGGQRRSAPVRGA